MAIPVDSNEFAQLEAIRAVDGESTRLPKLRVAGSNPVSRSNPLAGDSSGFFEEFPA